MQRTAGLPDEMFDHDGQITKRPVRALTLSALDEITGRRTDSNREIAGHGLGNMAASLIGGVIGSGAMLRSRPGFDAGGRTPAMGIFLSLILLAIVLGLADLIQFIPRAVIAGMILVIGFQSFDRWSFGLFGRFFTGSLKTRMASLADVFIIVLVVAIALTFDLIAAVGAGIVVSVVVFVSRMSRSLVRREFRGPAIHSKSVSSDQRQLVLRECGHRIAVLELDGAIFFGTAEGLEDRVHKLAGDGVTHMVLDMKRVKYIDSTGAFVLQRIHRNLSQQGGILALSYVLPERRKPVLHRLRAPPDLSPAPDLEGSAGLGHGGRPRRTGLFHRYRQCPSLLREQPDRGRRPRDRGGKIKRRPGNPERSVRR